MKRQWLGILVVGLALGADAPKEGEAAKDLERFQGSWTLVSSEFNGGKIDADTLEKAGVTMVFKGEKFTVTVNNADTEGTIKLDPSKKPGAFEIRATDAAGKATEGVGIYKFEEDTLTLCSVFGAGKAPPKEFEAGPGSETLLQVFKRAKK
jgi:uncharacterized protein (TIGR03067 family)